jgi:hypothetical protein
MIELRSGSFIVYKSIQCRLLSSTELKVTSSEKISLNYGFDQYPNGSTYFKYINKNDVSAAFQVITKAKYRGHTFQMIENKFVSDDDEAKLFLNNLDFDAYDMFGFNYRDDNANISVKVKDLDAVWEERQPLLDFPFASNKIYYIKGSS